jgi:hypothetical protein
LVTTTSKLDAALAYAAAGIAVFPCHTVTRGRCSCGAAGAGHPIGKHPRTNAGHLEATTDARQIRLWWAAWPDANIGAAMKASGLVAVDEDPRNGGDESWRDLTREAGASITDTWTNLTGGGGAHHIYRAPEGFDTHTDSVAPGLDIKWAGYVIFPPSDHKDQRRYEWEAGFSPFDRPALVLPEPIVTRIHGRNGAAPPIEERAPVAELLTRDCPAGERNDTLARIAGYLRNEVPEDVARGICEAWNDAHCKPPLDAAEVTKTVAGMYLRYFPPAEVILSDTPAPSKPLRDWPAPVGDAALHGLTGDLIRLADPCTEADPAGVLLTFLAMVGNALGRSPHIAFGTEIHRANIYIGLAGASGSGRKGTSLGPGRVVVGGADPPWAGSRIANGLVSGEGLIYHIRDAASEESSGGSSWKVVAAPKVKDAGVADKRLFCVETELGALLTAIHRQGSTLSHVLRAAWDGQKLQSLSKNQPVTATGAHVSLVGHITPEELRTALTGADAANGFGNRFLWGLVRRSKVLPRPPAFEGSAVDALIGAVNDVLDYGNAVGAMRLDAETGDAYDTYYRELPEDPPGMTGIMAVRQPAFVLRLSMIYALLDLSATIRRPHFEAAREVVRFCMDSARAIFGEMTGDPFADRILEALNAGPVSRQQISVEVFGKNVPASTIAGSLKTLERLGLAYPTRHLSGGRPIEVWSRW